MNNGRYVLRPKADEDLEEQSLYYALRATPAMGHRFLDAARDTFSLLASQPNLGWHCRLPLTELNSLRVFRVLEFKKILILYRPIQNGVEVLRVIHGSRNLQSLLRREGIE